MTSPDVTDARIAVLESDQKALAKNIERIEAAYLVSVGRMETKLERIETELASRPTEAMARSMARVWTFAGVFVTAFAGSVLHIAVNMN